MKTKPKPNTVKLKTIQSGIEAELHQLIQVNLLNKKLPSFSTELAEHVGITAIVPMYSDTKYRQGLKDAIKVVRAQFDSYR